MAKLAGTQQDAKAFLDGMKRDREPATVAAVAAQELQPQVQTLAVVWAHYKRPIQASALPADLAAQSSRKRIRFREISDYGATPLSGYRSPLP